jgi:hypothetical protein
MQWVSGALSARIKQPERKAVHSPPTSAEVNKTWIYTFTPHPSSWRSAWLVKHRDNFTFIIIIIIIVVVFIFVFVS